MNRRTSIVATVVTAVFALAGCGSTSATTTPPSAIVSPRPTATATSTSVVAVSPAPVVKPAAPQSVSLPQPPLPVCPTQYPHPITRLQGTSFDGNPVCVLVGLSYRNLPQTKVTFTVHLAGCNALPPVTTAVLSGTGTAKLPVIYKPCGGSGSFTITYSPPVRPANIWVVVATQPTD